MPAARRPAAVRVANGLVTARSGAYNRLVDPGWSDPLDSSYSQRNGGRWNPPGAFPCLYFNDTVATARIQVMHKLAGLPYGPEDLDPDQQHDLVGVEVPAEQYRDCVSATGLQTLGLPRTYPHYGNHRPVGWKPCQAIGRQAWAEHLPGVACRSAARGAQSTNEELCFFDRPGQPRPTLTGRLPFAQWWWEHSD